jgi:hypothetical protein
MAHLVSGVPRGERSWQMSEEKSKYFFGHEDSTSSCMVYTYGTMDRLMQGEARGGGRKMRRVGAVWGVICCWVLAVIGDRAAF